MSDERVGLELLEDKDWLEDARELLLSEVFALRVRFQALEAKEYAEHKDAILQKLADVKDVLRAVEQEVRDCSEWLSDIMKVLELVPAK